MILVKPGDLVISGINAEKGAIALYDENNVNPCAATIHYSSFSIDKTRADPKFLWFFFRSEIFRNILIHSLPKGIKTELKPFRLLKLEIPLPPLKEQQQIVTTLNHLLKRIEEALSQLEFTISEFEIFTKINSGIFYSNLIQRFGPEELINISHQITDGTHVTPLYVSDGVPFISIKDISSGKISFDDVKYISEEEHRDLIKRCRPEKDDILFTKIGSTTGIAKVIDVDREFSIFVSLALIKINKEKLLPKYLEYILNSGLLYKSSKSNTRGVGYKNLVLKFIKKYPIPVPPLSDQRLIVAHLDRLQAKVDEVKRLQMETKREMVALVPAVLAKAFGA
jgi:type I restriction enzyme S subunit